MRGDVFSTYFLRVNTEHSARSGAGGGARLPPQRGALRPLERIGPLALVSRLARPRIVFETRSSRERGCSSSSSDSSSLSNSSAVVSLSFARGLDVNDFYLPAAGGRPPLLFLLLLLYHYRRLGMVEGEDQVVYVSVS